MAYLNHCQNLTTFELGFSKSQSSKFSQFSTFFSAVNLSDFMTDFMINQLDRLKNFIDKKCNKHEEFEEV